MATAARAELFKETKRSPNILHAKAHFSCSFKAALNLIRQIDDEKFPVSRPPPSFSGVNISSLAFIGKNNFTDWHEESSPDFSRFSTLF